ncbi:hypothetical protein J2T17_007171 [Paenibacillus mucilaginosus]
MLFLVLAVSMISGCIRETHDDNRTSINPVQQNGKIVELSFSKVSNNQQLHELSSFDMTTVVKKESVSGGTVYIYSNKNDPEHVYGAYETLIGKYDLGIVGGLYQQMDESLLSIEEVTLNGKLLLCIKGVFGANAPIQNYFSQESGIVSLYLRIDTGHASIVDLDGDGNSEIVSSHGTPMRVFLYKIDKNEILMVNLNEALNAEDVFLEDTGIFRAANIDTSVIEKYKYQSGKLILQK